MKANQKKQAGFTIIEVVIVAAIIGILGAMGATAYQKFSAKAKQRQGKLYLSNAYLAQRTFFAEHFSFTQCLRQIKGFPGDPDRNGPAGANRPYLVGFINGNGAATCGPGANQSCYAFAFSPAAVLCDCGAGGPGGSNDCTADATIRTAAPAASAYVWQASQTTFRIGVAGFISDNPNADIWTMDQDKQLVMIQDGL